MKESRESSTTLSTIIILRLSLVKVLLVVSHAGPEKVVQSHAGRHSPPFPSVVLFHQRTSSPRRREGRKRRLAGYKLDPSLYGTPLPGFSTSQFTNIAHLLACGYCG